MDERVTLRFSDRCKVVIEVSGFQVWSNKVEEVVMMLPGVKAMKLSVLSCMARGLIVFVLIGTFFILADGCTPIRHLEAVLVLQDLAATDGVSRLKQTTVAPLRQPLIYTVAGRVHRADLYLPAPLNACFAANGEQEGEESRRSGHCPRAAIVTVPGAVPQGKDDPRLVAFATTLARVGFAVLVPDIEGFRELRIRPSDAREITDAFAYLASRTELAPKGHAGIFAFSYSVGPAILAALDDDIREQVQFVVGLGGYHDLVHAMRFFTTGWYEHAGKWHYLFPDDTGKLVLAYSSLGYLSDGRDRAVFDRMVALRSRNPLADLTPLSAGLSSDGQAVYALAINPDPGRFTELFSKLPAAMRADIENLDLARHDLKPLKARLILVHGRNDNLIPYSESLALAAAVPRRQASVFLIHRVLGHVDLGISTLFSWRFWSKDLPDLWRLWRVIDLLLAERREGA